MENVVAQAKTNPTADLSCLRRLDRSESSSRRQVFVDARSHRFRRQRRRATRSGKHLTGPPGLQRPKEQPGHTISPSRFASLVAPTGSPWEEPPRGAPGPCPWSMSLVHVPGPCPCGLRLSLVHVPARYACACGCSCRHARGMSLCQYAIHVRIL